MGSFGVKTETFFRLCYPSKRFPKLNQISQGGHKPRKHGKPEKLRELEKLSKSQGKLREN